MAKKLDPWIYNCRLIRGVDGDTADAWIDGKFTVKSHGVGKYGRLLGEIFIKGEDKSLNQLLIDNGHAYEYSGGKKKVLGG